MSFWKSDTDKGGKTTYTTFDIIGLMGLLLIVVAVIATVIFTRCSDEPTRARVVQAQLHISVIERALDQYFKDNGTYPTNDDGLGSLRTTLAPDGSPYLAIDLVDPWGNAYQYSLPGDRSSAAFDIWSDGANGKPDGEGLAKDIGNWREQDT